MLDVKAFCEFFKSYVRACSRPMDHTSRLSEIIDVEGMKPLRRKLVYENINNDDLRLLPAGNSFLKGLTTKRAPTQCPLRVLLKVGCIAMLLAAKYCFQFKINDFFF